LPAASEAIVVQPVYLFNLAAQHAHWATARQATITGNIANANTGGYTALDIEPFSAALDDASGLSMASTRPGHIDASGRTAEDSANFAVKDSGAPVTVDQQLMKADETNRAFSLDTAIMRAFHRMLLTSLRSGA
jgi:flagellar basal-body rod protein FlgB